MSRARTIGYWVTTAWVALSMGGGGIAHVMHVPATEAGFIALGYPLHVVTLLGIWKVLGAIALLVPKFPRLKEWAYAGFVFDLTGAAFAWAATGASDADVSNTGHIVAALVGLPLVFASWALRPASRKLPDPPRDP